MATLSNLKKSQSEIAYTLQLNRPNQINSKRHPKTLTIPVLDRSRHWRTIINTLSNNSGAPAKIVEVAWIQAWSIPEATNNLRLLVIAQARWTSLSSILWDKGNLAELPLALVKPRDRLFSYRNVSDLLMGSPPRFDRVAMNRQKVELESIWSRPWQTK